MTYRMKTALIVAISYGILIGALGGLSILVGGCSAGSSASAPTTPPTPPTPPAAVITITSEPTSAAVVAPTPATFSVGAACSTGCTLSYQWEELLPGAIAATVVGDDSATYTTGATSSSENGAQFFVNVSSDTDPVSSSPAILTVTQQQQQGNFTPPNFVTSVSYNVSSGTCATGCTNGSNILHIPLGLTTAPGSTIVLPFVIQLNNTLALAPEISDDGGNSYVEILNFAPNPAAAGGNLLYPTQIWESTTGNPATTITVNLTTNPAPGSGSYWANFYGVPLVYVSSNGLGGQNYDVTQAAETNNVLLADGYEGMELPVTTQSTGEVIIALGQQNLSTVNLQAAAAGWNQRGSYTFNNGAGQTSIQMVVEDAPAQSAASYVPTFQFSASNGCIPCVVGAGGDSAIAVVSIH